jgi:nitrate/nitrite-specific signal transduction histidine kinase
MAERMQEHLRHLVGREQLAAWSDRIGEAFADWVRIGTVQTAADGWVFTALMAELVDAVGEHPDRTQILAAGGAALHRTLQDEPAPADSWSVGSDDPAALAREVHDWVGSGVSLALVQLDMHAVAASRGEPAAARRVSEARRILQELQREIRRLVSDLQGRTWVSGLEAEIRDFVARANVLGARTTVVVRGDEDALPTRLRDEVFVVVREALHNAFTHAGAEHVTVVVEIGADVRGGTVRASVDDDGIGLGATRSSGRGGGLSVMRERARNLGGTLTVTETRPRGTRVDLQVDLPTGVRR